MVTKTQPSTLPMPVVCACGYATMDAKKAIEHIKTNHPELWAEYREDVLAEQKEVWRKDRNAGIENLGD